ncbi:hypothetical protein R1sor_024771 [Riccia sorocarpa]|uniref:DELLA protein n=1 Tax=Riccia sorocarpa TaxID=122646 RepID=A0ABD3GUL3_9MARC
MAEEDANGLTLKDRMEIINRDEICYNLELVLSAMYEADRTLAIGFQADNIMAMREAFRSVHGTLQCARPVLWRGMAGVDQALSPGVKSQVPSWKKLFEKAENAAQMTANVLQNHGIPTFSKLFETGSALSMANGDDCSCVRLPSA